MINAFSKRSILSHTSPSQQTDLQRQMTIELDVRPSGGGGGANNVREPGHAASL